MVDKLIAQLKKLDSDTEDNCITMQELITILLTIQTSIFHQIQTVFLR